MLKQIEPRDLTSLQNINLFDEGVYESEIQRLMRDLLANCIEEDAERLAMTQRRAFKPVTPYPYDEVVRNEKFKPDDLRGKAKEILEEERHRYVQDREKAIKRDLQAMLTYYRRILLKIDADGNVSHISLIELGKKPTDYVRTNAGLIELSAIDGNFLSLQRHVPYYTQETQDLNQRIHNLRDGKIEPTPKTEG